jgi:protein associated with RNAse G/E
MRETFTFLDFAGLNSTITRSDVAAPTSQALPEERCGRSLWAWHAASRSCSFVNDNNEAEQKIIVRACKFDGSEHRRWSARIIGREDNLLILDAQFEEEIRHQLLGIVARGTTSIEYYWLDRWYNIFRFLHPNGELRSFYCNVNVPPSFDGSMLSYIDLDMDILVAPDLSYRIVDEDEFMFNADRYGYPPQIRKQAYQALDELVTLIEKRDFPFCDLK